jgi:hypothetical protein
LGGGRTPPPTPARVMDKTLLASQAKTIRDTFSEDAFYLGSDTDGGGDRLDVLVASLGAERASYLYGVTDSVTFSLSLPYSELPKGFRNGHFLRFRGEVYSVIGHEIDAAQSFVRIDLGHQYG